MARKKVAEVEDELQSEEAEAPTEEVVVEEVPAPKPVVYKLGEGSTPGAPDGK